MTPEFVRKYHIYQLLTKTSENSCVSKGSIRFSLENVYEQNRGSKLYDGFIKNNDRTIKRDIKDIESFFGVEIAYKKSQQGKNNGGYYIVDLEDVDVKQRLILDKMELFLASHKEKEWSPYVSAEESSLNTNLDILALIKAIEHKVWVTISYHGWFDDDNFEEIKNARVQPLHIKQYYRGWYLLVYNKEIEIKVLCLDIRVTALEISNTPIDEPIHFEVADYFKDSFGVLKNDVEPQKIVLKVVSHHFKYLETKPLHHSQKMIAQPKKKSTNSLDYTDDAIFGTIELFLQPNHEFIIELLKFSWWVKIEEPKWLAEHLVKQYQFMQKHYYADIVSSS